MTEPRLTPHTATVVLYQGDDMPRLAELKRAVDLAQMQVDRAREEREEAAENPHRYADELPVVDTRTLQTAQAAYDAATETAAARALEVEVRGIGRRRFRDLVLEHPAREVDTPPDTEGKTTRVTHPDDAEWGQILGGALVNTETFPSALLTYRDGDKVTIARPEFNTKAEVQQFVDDDLTEGDFERLWVTAFWANRGQSADPKAVRDWTPSPSGDET